jgi:AmiR/NasT family two-component response regulator
MNHVSEDDHEHALNSRVLIEQAEGVLARVHGVEVDAAFELLRGCARSHNRNWSSSPGWSWPRRVPT